MLRIKRIGVELEFLHDELTRILEETPPRRFEVYFYRNMNHKKRLMGARNTRIAKPWQYAFHIDAPRIGASVIRHELIHLFAAAFGAKPLSIAQSQTGLPNMVLTEGLAEAFSPRDEQLSLHEWTAALERIGKRPRIENLLSTQGFYQSSARSAYTVCGSLIAYTSEKYGLDAVKDWYKQGVWNQQPAFFDLIEEWTRHLNSIELPNEAIETARARFDTPSIFRKVCAHEVAQLKDKIRQHVRHEEHHKALVSLNTLMRFTPNDRWARLSRLEQLAATERYEEARTEALLLSTDSNMGKVTRDLASEWLADLNVVSGQIELADETYNRLRATAFRRNTQRRLDVKVLANRSAQLRTQVIKLLSFTKNRSAATHALENLYKQFPNEPVVIYLRARNLIARNQPLIAVQQLKKIEVAFDQTSLKLEVARLLAVTSFNQHCYQQATHRYQQIISTFTDDLTDGERNHFSNWSRRSAFFSKAASLASLSCPLEIDNLKQSPHDGGTRE